jgi:hypothetical protein
MLQERDKSFSFSFNVLGQKSSMNINLQFATDFSASFFVLDLNMYSSCGWRSDSGCATNLLLSGCLPSFTSSVHQGCQMVCIQTKNHNLGKFWRALE